MNFIASPIISDKSLRGIGVKKRLMAIDLDFNIGCDTQVITRPPLPPAVTTGYKLLTPTVGIKRSGVIPYTIHDGIIYVLMACDRRTGEYGDFGGTIKTGENPIHAACREFREESLGIFSDMYDDHNLIISSICLCKGDMAMLFLPVSPTFMTCQPMGAGPNKCNKEVSDIAWVSATELSTMLTGKASKKLWTKIRRFLCSYQLDTTVYPLLLNLYYSRFPLQYITPNQSTDRSDTPGK